MEADQRAGILERQELIACLAGLDSVGLLL